MNNGENLTQDQMGSLQDHLNRTGGEPNYDETPQVSQTEENPVNLNPGGTLDTHQIAQNDETVHRVNELEHGPGVNVSTGGQNMTLKDKIKKVESEVYETPLSGATKTSADSFKDEMGDETFYVKNISGTHIIVSDLEMGRESRGVKIAKGAIMDLLAVTSLENIKKSRDIRGLLEGQKRLLKRLTEHQYYEELQRLKNAKNRIEVMKQQDLANVRRAENVNNQNPEMNLPHMRQTTINPEPNKIRPMVESWLEKLRLSTDPDPENAKHGINAQEFISWLDRERLTNQELDFVLTHPQVVHEHDIKAAVFRIKGGNA